MAGFFASLLADFGETTASSSVIHPLPYRPPQGGRGKNNADPNSPSPLEGDRREGGRAKARRLRGVAMFAACLLLSLAACESDEGPTITGQREVIPGAHVSVSLPEGVSVVRRSDRPDAAIYDFSLDKHVFMGLYVGLAPSFHPPKDEDDIETETVNGFAAETRVVRSPDGAWSRDIVVELSGHRFGHFFYRNLREPDLLIADHIIGSLHDGP